MKVFSYSLFEPKILPEYRTWDNWAKDSQRYWFNIPTIILLNNFIYPDYKTKFYLSPNIKLNKLFDIFNILNVEYEIIEREYNITEPAIWRMIPLWERNTQVLHSRDIDSLSSLNEYKYIKSFEQSNCCVGTIRSHENHYGMPCRMLAGLCSFKPNQIPYHIKGINFDMYYSKKDLNYGSDQNLLIKTFTLNEDFTKTNFLDCKIDKQLNKQDFLCLEANLNDINVDNDIIKIYNKVSNLLNHSWLGQPCDSRGELLNYLLSDQKNVKNNILQDKYISNFYKVK